MMKFENLEVYQKALDFANEVYIALKMFPVEEKFGLIDQLRIASVSISTNIAEGSGRYHKSSYKQFLRISRSSAYECVALLQISKKQNFLSEETYGKLYEELVVITKMLSGLIRFLGD